MKKDSLQCLEFSWNMYLIFTRSGSCSAPLIKYQGFYFSKFWVNNLPPHTIVILLDNYGKFSLSSSRFSKSRHIFNRTSSVAIIGGRSDFIFLFNSSWRKSPPWPEFSFPDKLKLLWILKWFCKVSGICTRSQISRRYSCWYFGWCME